MYLDSRFDIRTLSFGLWVPLLSIALCDGNPLPSPALNSVPTTDPATVQQVQDAVAKLNKAVAGSKTVSNTASNGADDLRAFINPSSKRGDFVVRLQPLAQKLRGSNQAQQTNVPIPDSAKDLQKAAEEAKNAAEETKKALAEAKDALAQAQKALAEAKIASDNARNAQAGAVSAAGTAKDSAASTDKAKADADAAAASAAKKALLADAAAGIALNGSTNVKDNVNAQVVLLPRKQAERVFSKEVGRHYAVVQATINNKSKDASFILHSIFVDYSQWALSGLRPNQEGVCDEVPENSQGITCPGQVASVESRVVRGELQDASTWTWRNGFIRATVLVGTMASGIPAFGSKNALRYVGAYNGQFVPGLQAFWPDATIPQLNRVSDFGFQTNKVIAKENSDIVYAFFPIDRFLTPGMRNIFLNAPALFFAPAQIFVDPRIGKDCHKWKPEVCLRQSDVDEMKVLLENMAAAGCATNDANLKKLCVPEQGTQAVRDQKMLSLLMMDCGAKLVHKEPQSTPQGTPPAQKEQPPDPCMIARPVQTIVERISLNTINVLVQGVMTVDVTMVPGSITDVIFDKGNDSADVWQETAKPVDGNLSGRFLTGGTPSVTGIDLPAGKSSQIGDYIDPKTISVVTDDSNDTRLRFKLQWKKEIPAGSKLHFQVTKTDSKKNPVKSMDFLLAVNYAPKPPTVSDVTVDMGDAADTWKAGSMITGTITGSFLDGAAPRVTKIAVPGDKNASVDQYVDKDTVKTDTTKTNDSASLHFTATLKKVVLDGSTLTFQATKKDLNPNTKEYIVKIKGTK